MPGGRLFRTLPLRCGEEPLYSGENRMNAIDWKWLLFSFDGRLTRRPFWIAHLCYYLPFTALAPFLGKVASAYIAVFFLFYPWPLTAIHVKRWHDRDKSGGGSLSGSLP